MSRKVRVTLEFETPDTDDQLLQLGREMRDAIAASHGPVRLARVETQEIYWATVFSIGAK